MTTLHLRFVHLHECTVDRQHFRLLKENNNNHHHTWLKYKGCLEQPHIYNLGRSINNEMMMIMMRKHSYLETAKLVLVFLHFCGK